jgi:hypothetical protein
MRRVAICIVLFAIAAAFLAVWLVWPRPPALVVSLRAMPAVGKVEYSGPSDAASVVVHLRDWHFVPRDLCKIDGIDFDKNLAIVERVQADELAVARSLIAEHGLKEVYCEGLTEHTLPALRLRLDLLKDLDTLADLGGLDDAARRHRRELSLEVGVPGQLLHAGQIGAVMPLEDDATLAGARPVDGPVGVRFDDGKLDARRRAMAARLPAANMVLIVLGGSHDLRPYLGINVLYVRVTPRNYPAE